MFELINLDFLQHSHYGFIGKSPETLEKVRIKKERATKKGRGELCASYGVASDQSPQPLGWGEHINPVVLPLPTTIMYTKLSLSKGKPYIP